IYFSSDRSGRPEIWKTSVEGGSAVQITREGGTEPIESLDGKSIYYLHPSNSEPAAPDNDDLGLARQLKRVSVIGGRETVVLDAIMRSHWAVTTQGVFFLTRGPEFDALDLYSPVNGRVTRLGRLPFQVTPIGTIGRFTVSRDGRWVLTVQEDRWERDIAMIENFR
ncbi:MAG: TolB family protein, partial [Longimicrobiales bacterium]